MEKLILLSIASFLAFFNNRPNHISYDKIPTVPPGTVKVSANYFVDKREVSNIDYEEYLFWLKGIFGVDSEKVMSAIPNEKVWSEAGIKNAEDLITIYLLDVKYMNFPVVGVSWEQANDYLSWRNDRVYEAILVKKGWIKFNPHQTPENYFTIERYLKGTITGSIPKHKPPVPAYRLPSIQEWEKIAAYKTSPYGSKYHKEKIARSIEKGEFLFNTKERFSQFQNAQDSTSTPTTPVCTFKPNHHQICDLIGNVAEMTDEKGFAKGGSWQQPLSDCEISDNIAYSKPTAWLGFRAVCTWKKVE